MLDSERFLRATRSLLDRGKSSPFRKSIVRRKGVTAANWYDNTTSVDIRVVNERSFDEGKAAAITFVLASKGGGDTLVSVRINPKDFPLLLQAMSAVDRQATLDAICSELTYQVAS